MQESILFQKITEMHTPERTLLAGMDGLGGAGKSTMAEQLMDALKSAGYSAILLHIDHFIHPRAVRYNDSYSEWECYYKLQWRYDYLLQNILLPLKNCNEISQDIELYNLDNDSYDRKPLHVPNGSIVIVEGIFLQRSELAGIFDIMTYVDVPEDVRLKRVLKRDSYIGDQAAITEKYERRYFPAERHYVQECRPAKIADIVIA